VDVAVKILNKRKMKSMIDRVRLEIKALKSLSHPNITKLYGIIDTKHEILIVMELCSNNNLFELIN
jgi:maternal embryonic leucine zipper kinase